MKIELTFEQLELMHLLGALRIAREGGTYYGNKKRFIKRHSELEKRLKIALNAFKND